MQRGKSQVLFRYLPECIIDHSDTQAIAKIVSWDTIKSESINETRLSSEVMRRLVRFGKKRGYPQTPRPESFVFLEPKAIDVELFPLTFVCNACGKAHSFDNIERFAHQFGMHGYKCSCGGKLRQLDMINYHKCGKIAGLKIRPCPTHGYDFVTLQTNNSSRTSNWRWRCNICSTEIGNVAGWCSECSQPMETAPFRKSQVFYPHSISLINTGGSGKSVNYENSDQLKLYIAQYLGIISKEEYLEFRDSSKDDERQNNAEKIRQELLAKGFPEELINAAVGVVEGTEMQKKCQGAIHQIERSLNVEGEALLSLVSSLQSYQDTVSLPDTKNIKNVLDEAQERNDPNLSRIREFPKALEMAGISEAYVVSDLPVVSAVFGYSRSTPNPAECTLRGFNYDRKYPDRTPIYVNPTETEGIVIVFDRWKILRWMQENHFVSEIPDKTDELGLKQWFLKKIGPNEIPIYDEIPDLLTETKQVYSLIHTLSHVLIRNAAGLVGMDKDSLAEVIFPTIPAVIIYTNNAHDFQIGGMHSLFETGIIPWIDMAFKSVETCLYDPVCITSEASCHACLHISEISCTHFNRDLGRDYLIGSETGKRQLLGFWEREFSRRLK
jgi:hypothetical protein